MNEPSLIIVGGRVIPERRRRGRPRVEEPLSAISTRVPESEHDRLIKEANRLEISLSELVRWKITGKR